MNEGRFGVALILTTLPAMARPICVHLRLSAVPLLFAVAAHAAEPPEDPFAYLENRDDPRAQEFARVQAAATEKQLAALPGRQRILERVRALSEGQDEVSALAIAG